MEFSFSKRRVIDGRILKKDGRIVNVRAGSVNFVLT